VIVIVIVVLIVIVIFIVALIMVVCLFLLVLSVRIRILQDYERVLTHGIAMTPFLPHEAVHTCMYYPVFVLASVSTCTCVRLNHVFVHENDKNVFVHAFMITCMCAYVHACRYPCEMTCSRAK
jgi:hypothetical protein